MEYRKLPHGGPQEAFSVLGLGTGGLHLASDAEIEQVIRDAIDHGINFFDLCAGGRSVYEPSAAPYRDGGRRYLFRFISEPYIRSPENTAGQGI